MANKMLIDATHPEETRVVVLRGNRVEEFDFEAANRKQLRGNIYLAKVTRVEPSLQAAFVDYGGNRHGFLAFSEIHPDYYQIPVADRLALLEDERLRRRPDDDFEPADDEADLEEIDDVNIDDVSEADSEEPVKPARTAKPARSRAPRKSSRSRRTQSGSDADAEAASPAEPSGSDDAPEPSEKPVPDRFLSATEDDDAVVSGDAPVEESESAAADADGEPETGESPNVRAAGISDEPADESQESQADETPLDSGAFDAQEDGDEDEGDAADAQPGDGNEPETARRNSSKASSGSGRNSQRASEPAQQRPPRRRYKIQEVIKRRQIILVQVVKEERGNKGAALTTYLSLAGRYSVLMPNSARGGGISRKITNPGDRKRLKQIANELPVPEGMGVILRTAGASRTKTEVKRDFEYLMRLWENVRDLTLQSSAPALVYEEGNLVKRSIRDLYNKDIDEVLVAGDVGYREAKDFMRMLMPSHAKNVQPYKEQVPIFAKNRVEPQLDAMFLPQVTLPSGGYVVINQTEALVAVDVNSGKSTREHNIEDTALRTNVEAAEEIARQLRLRDLAGLIVIDFIDMEENRNNRTVERKLKDCLKTDRARIQVGRISHFGLLEMSRQRLRTGVLESSTELCPHCHGTGVIRSIESVALHVLRSIEDQLLRNASHNLDVRIRTATALYIINNKRYSLTDMEDRYGVSLNLVADETIREAYCIIDRNGVAESRRAPAVALQGPGIIHPETVDPDEPDDEEDAEAISESETENVAVNEPEAEGEGDAGRKKRRRKRRRRGRDGDSESENRSEEDSSDEGETTEEASSADADADGDEAGAKKRRRGRRGGRRNKRVEGDGSSQESDDADSGAQATAKKAAKAESAGAPDRSDDTAGQAGSEADPAGAAPEPDAAELSPEIPGATETDAPAPSDVQVPVTADNSTEEAAVSDAVSDGPEAQVDEAPPASAQVEKLAAEAGISADSDAAPEAEDAAIDEPETAKAAARLPAHAVADQESDAESNGPKKSGWWQKRSFFKSE